MSCPTFFYDMRMRSVRSALMKFNVRVPSPGSAGASGWTRSPRAWWHLHAAGMAPGVGSVPQPGPEPSPVPAPVRFRGRKWLIAALRWDTALAFSVTNLHLSLTSGPARVRRFSENNEQEEVKSCQEPWSSCSQGLLWQVAWLLTKDEASPALLAGHCGGENNHLHQLLCLISTVLSLSVLAISYPAGIFHHTRFLCYWQDFALQGGKGSFLAPRLLSELQPSIATHAVHIHRTGGFSWLTQAAITAVIIRLV